MRRWARDIALVLLRFLPAVAALAIPFVTPGVRDSGPFLGADYLQRNPEAYAGRTLWVRFYLAADRPPPAPGEIVEVSRLRDRRTSFSGNFAFLQGTVDKSGATLRVLDLRTQSEELRIPYALQMGVGAVVFLAFLVLFFRPAPGLTVEVRPWIR